MTTALDKLINDAEKALENTEDGSPERAATQAKLDGLTSVKDAGIGFTQADLNRIDKQAKDGYEASIKDVLGMTLDEAKEAIAGVEESLTTGEGEAPNKGDEGSPIERMTAALGERDQKIQASDTRITDLSRSLYSERVENNLRRSLADVQTEDGTKYKLKDGRFDAVRALAGEGDLVGKLMGGESLDAGAYKQAAHGLYATLPEVFEADRPAEAEAASGPRLREDRGPAIPPTQTPNGNQGLTDEQRLAASSSPFR